MKKSDVKILIVDDDPTMLSTLGSLVESEGYKPIQVSDPKAAMRAAKVNIVHFAIIDVMLSGMNGVDLAQELRKTGVNSPIILISGIFKDKSFMEKSKEKAQAKAFFKKPFNSQELLSVIAETLKPVLEKPKLPLQALLLQEKVSARDKIKALDRVESITGLDLVYILSLLIHSNLKGHLNVKKGPDIYSISFSEGSLVKVEGPMTVAIVKDLLVKKEYLSVQDIQVLNEKKIKGDFVQGLIDENYISPHILPEIRNFQAITEIKNLVNEEEIEINFSKDRKLDFTYKLDENLFHFLLSEIIEENFDMDWFKDFYLMLKNHPLKVNASDRLSYFKQMPIVTNVKGLFEVLEKEPTIGEILSEDKFDEDRFFRAIHFLAVNRIVTFSESVRSMSVFSDLSRLKALNDKIQQLDPFQIFQYFGSKKSCPPSEVNRLYKEFAKSYHPDKLSGKGSEDQKKLLHELFARVTEAHSILTDEEKRSKYTQEMEQESVEKQLKSEGLLEEGVKFLKKSDFESAKKLFQAAKELYTTPRLNLLCLWVQLKLSDFGKLDPKFNLQVDAALEKYYEHERNTFEYMMVKGLQLAHQHIFEKATKTFIPLLDNREYQLIVRRELNLIKTFTEKNKKGNENIFTADIGTVIGNLFNKKKSG